jgi:hypothetical protein
MATNLTELQTFAAIFYVVTLKYRVIQKTLYTIPELKIIKSGNNANAKEILTKVLNKME